MKKYRELITYVFWGGMTTVVNYIVYFACTKLLAIEYLISNVIAWVVAVIFAFWVNKIYVFQSYGRDKKTMLHEFGTFVSARVLSGVLETGMMALFVSVMHLMIRSSRLLLAYWLSSSTMCSASWSFLRNRRRNRNESGIQYAGWVCEGNLCKNSKAG